MEVQDYPHRGGWSLFTGKRWHFSARGTGLFQLFSTRENRPAKLSCPTPSHLLHHGEPFRQYTKQAAGKENEMGNFDLPQRFISTGQR